MNQKNLVYFIFELNFAHQQPNVVLMTSKPQRHVFLPFLKYKNNLIYEREDFMSIAQAKELNSSKY